MRQTALLLLATSFVVLSGCDGSTSTDPKAAGSDTTATKPPSGTNTTPGPIVPGGNSGTPPESTTTPPVVVPPSGSKCVEYRGTWTFDTTVSGIQSRMTLELSSNAFTTSSAMFAQLPGTTAPSWLTVERSTGTLVPLGGNRIVLTTKEVQSIDWTSKTLVVDPEAEKPSDTLTYSFPASGRMKAWTVDAEAVPVFTCQ